MSGSVQNYLNLVTSKHASKPNFLATVATSVQGMADAQGVLNGLAERFDIDFAVGAQLDIIGLWVGISRELSEPLTGVYFSFGVAGVGWGQGTWKGPFDPTSGLVSLPDDTYRILLKAKIAANQWDGTAPGAYEVYADLFAILGGNLLISNNANMTITIGYQGAPLNAVATALLNSGLLTLVAAGVSVTGYVQPSVSGAAFFGFGAETSAVSGFGAGAWATPL